MNERRDFEYPLAYRLLRGLGGRFGLRWVGDLELAVIYRLERYQAVKGPGFFWINPFMERVHSVSSLAPDFLSTPFPGIQTRDALQMDITLALAYVFDLRLAPPDKAPLYVRWTREGRQDIVKNHAYGALQSVVPAFYAEQICRGEVFKLMQEQFLEVLAGRLKPLAFVPTLALVLRVQVPAALRSRFEAVVQRTVNIEHISQYRPYELTQALRTEAVEAFRHMAAGKQYVNMPDLSDMMQPPIGEGEEPRRQMTGPEAPREQDGRLQPKPPPSRRPQSRL